MSHHTSMLIKQLEKEIMNRHYKTDPVITTMLKLLKVQQKQIDKLERYVTIWNKNHYSK